MRFLLRTDEPFRGHVQSVLTSDGTVAYTEGLSVDEYARDRGFPVRIVDDAELEKLTEEFVGTLITAPTEETPGTFEDALNILPPCRHCTHRGIEVFHISERLTHDLVAWHGRLGDRCFTFTDRAGLSLDMVATKIAAAAGVPQPRA